MTKSVKALAVVDAFGYFMAGSAFVHIYVIPFIDWITK